LALGAAQFLDSLAMVELADGDPARAKRYLKEAVDITGALDRPVVAQGIRTHRAFALPAAGALTRARDLAASDASAHAALAIKHQPLLPFLALADGDRSAVRAPLPTRCADYPPVALSFRPL
jgi:hypothetical protein